MRRGKRLVIALVVLAVLALVADRGGQLAVERIAAGQMQDALATPDRPDVDLGGFPFLSELFSQRFADVTVDIEDADAGKVLVARVHAELGGVKRQGTGVHADDITGDGLIVYPALTQAAKDAGAPVQVSFGGDGLVAITAEVTVAGREFTATAAGRPRIEGNELIVKPERASTSLGGDVGAAAGLVPEIRVRLRDIPQNLRIVLDPQADGIRFTFAGKDVQLASADSTSAAAEQRPSTVCRYAVNVFPPSPSSLRGRPIPAPPENRIWSPALYSACDHGFDPGRYPVPALSSSRAGGCQ